MAKEYSLVWKTFLANSNLGKNLGAERDFSLPYFIDGNDKIRFEQGTLYNFAEIHLLRGLLIGYFEEPPQVDINYSRTLFKKVIEDLKKYFDFQTTENLILDISSVIRRENGDFASHIALITGLEFNPESSKIRFDLCVDLFNMLERNEYKKKDVGINLLNENFKKIKAKEIRPDLVEYLKHFQDYINNMS